MAILHVETVAPPAGEARARLAVLHGIFGRGRNWATWVRRLVATRPGWGGRLLDLRGHGDSPPGEPPHTVAAAAADVVVTLQADGAAALLGHSFGGKVAAAAAIRLPGLRQLWIIDTGLAPRPPGGLAWRLAQWLGAELPDRVPDRATAVAWLEARGVPRAVAQWFAMNLERDGEALHWRLDGAVMRALLEDFFRLDGWALLAALPPELDVHLVQALDADTWSREDEERAAAAAAAGRLRWHRLPGGHWLNVDNPLGLLALVASHLPDPAARPASR